jgi:hypothetical protein
MSTSTGYGNVPGKMNGGKRISAHRRAWQLHNCCDPGELCVLHRCDNRNCANPAHLFLGTHRTNLFDCVRKGRVNACSPGEAHPHARLTDAIVTEIRAGHEETLVLAERYGVKKQTIAQARQGRSWRHLPMPDDAPAGLDVAPVLGSKPEHHARAE